MLGKTNDYGVDGELRGITAEQASSAELHGLDFLKKVDSRACGLTAMSSYARN